MPRRCLLRAEKRVRVTDETFSKWRLQRDSLGFQYDDEYAQYLLRVGESLQKMNMLDQKEGAGGSTTADVGLESSRNEDEPRDANSPTELETDDMSQSGDETNSDNDNHESPEVTQTSIKAFKRTLAPPREGKNNDNSYSARKLDLGWCTAEYDRQQVLSGITDQRRFVAHLLNSHNQWCSTCRTSAATLTASSMAQEKSDFAASNPELKIPTSWESKKWFEDLNAHSNMSITSFLLHLLLIYSHWHSIPLPGRVKLPRDVAMFARTADDEENLIAPYPTPELLTRVAQDILNRSRVGSSDDASEPLGCEISVTSEAGDVKDFTNSTNQLLVGCETDDTCRKSDDPVISEIAGDFVEGRDRSNMAVALHLKSEDRDRPYVSPDDHRRERWDNPGAGPIEQSELGYTIYKKSSPVCQVGSGGIGPSGDGHEVSDKSFSDDVHMVTDENRDSNGNSDVESWVVSENLDEEEVQYGSLRTGCKEITKELRASGHDRAKVLVACTTCLKLFPSQRALAEHRRVMRCPYCDFDVTPDMVTGNYGCVDVMKTHRMVCHLERYGFSNIQCRYCDFSLDPEMVSDADRCRAAMAAHVLENHPENVSSKPKVVAHKCDYCDFVLGPELKRTANQYRSLLAIHKREEHPEMFENTPKSTLKFLCKPPEAEVERSVMEHLEKDMAVSENEVEPTQESESKSTIAGYYKCEYCDFSLNPDIKRQPRIKRAQLASHQREKHPELFKNAPKATLHSLCKPTRCEYCEFSLEPDMDRTDRQSRTLLENHKRDMHPDVFPVQPQPSRTRKKKVDAREKKSCPPKKKSLKVDAPDEQVCPICEKVCTRLRFKEHVAGHKRKSTCPYCNFVVDAETAKNSEQCRAIMFNHRKENHPEHFQKYLCDICGRGMASSESLQLHKVDVHCVEIAAAKRKCRDCGEILPSLSKLEVHRNKNHSEHVPCTHAGCSKTFSNSYHLKRHMLNVHAKTYDIACTFEGCTRMFSRKTHMERHVKQIHMKAESFLCDFPDCGKCFYSTYNLRVHKRVHSQEKPLKCPHCDYRANQRNSINLHLKKHATGKADTIYLN